MTMDIKLLFSRIYLVISFVEDNQYGIAKWMLNMICMQLANCETQSVYDTSRNAEYLFLCGAYTEVINCLRQIQDYFRGFVMSNGLITNRLKSVVDDVGTLSVLPMDIRSEFIKLIQSV